MKTDWRAELVKYKPLCAEVLKQAMSVIRSASNSAEIKRERSLALAWIEDYENRDYGYAPEQSKFGVPLETVISFTGVPFKIIKMAMESKYYREDDKKWVRPTFVGAPVAAKMLSLPKSLQYSIQDLYPEIPVAYTGISKQGNYFLRSAIHEAWRTKRRIHKITPDLYVLYKYLRGSFCQAIVRDTGLPVDYVWAVIRNYGFCLAEGRLRK